MALVYCDGTDHFEDQDNSQPGCQEQGALKRDHKNVTKQLHNRETHY